MPEFFKKLGTELLAGDLHEGEMSKAGMAGNVLIGFIPIVGQAADARDTAAAIKDLYNNPTDVLSYALLGLALVQWVPGTDFLKGFKPGIKKALGNGNWKVFFGFSNKTKLLIKGHSKKSRVKYSLKNLVSDDRTHSAIRAQYRRSNPREGLGEIHLHHLWFQNKNKKVPRRFRNMGLNYLEIPGELNTWMGGRNKREFTFRAIVAGIMAGSFALGMYGGWQLGNKIMNKSNNRTTFHKKLNID